MRADPGSITGTSLTFWMVLLAVVITLGVFLPVQTDEITWDIPNHRAIADHLSVMTLLPQCEAAEQFAKPLPLSWYPFAAVNHLVFMEVDGLWWIRGVGVMRFLLFMGCAWSIVRALAPRLSASPTYLFVLFSCALSMDALPLLMQVARPEQTLLLGAAIFIALALQASSLAGSALTRWGACVLFLMTALLVFPAHPRAFAVLPVALVCAYELFRKTMNAKAAIAVMLLLTGFAAQAVMFWLSRYACPLSQPTRNFITENGLPVRLLGSDPGLFFAAVLHALLLGLGEDFFLTHTSWIPPTLMPRPAALETTVFIFGIVVRVLRLGVLNFCVCTAAVAVKNSLTRRPEEADSRFLPMLGCAATLSILTFLCLAGPLRRYYHSGFEVPVLFICTLVWLAALRKNMTASPYLRFTCTLIRIAAVCNISLLLYSYYAYAIQPEERQRQAEALFVRANKDVLYWPSEYAAQSKAVASAYRACGFPPLSQAKHLVLDDYSYPVLRHSWQPFSFHYLPGELPVENVIPPFKAGDFFAELKRYHSDGVLVNCKHLPRELDSVAARHDGYCCIPAAAIEKYRPLP